MKIYTKTGDKGMTSLVYGERISKADLKIEAYGTIDEFNAVLGLLRDQKINISRVGFIEEIQSRLFDIGSSLATEISKQSKTDIFENDIKNIELAIDNLTSQLPDLKHFILPGGHESISVCHLARTVCRRAERTIVRFNEIEKIDNNIIIYLNRLSDYLFVLGRKIGLEMNVEEIKWSARKKS